MARLLIAATAGILLAAVFLAGYLTHRARTRRVVRQLTAQIDDLMASVAAIAPEAVELRQQVLVHNERRLHATRARLDAFHLFQGRHA